MASPVHTLPDCSAHNHALRLAGGLIIRNCVGLYPATDSEISFCCVFQSPVGLVGVMRNGAFTFFDSKIRGIIAHVPLCPDCDAIVTV